MKSPDYYIVWTGRNRDCGIIRRTHIEAARAGHNLQNTGRAYVSTGLDKMPEPIIEEIDWVPEVPTNDALADAAKLAHTVLDSLVGRGIRIDGIELARTALMKALTDG